MSKDDGWGSKWPVATTLEDVAKLKSPEDSWGDLIFKPICWPKEATTNSATLKSQGSNLVDNETYLYFQCESCETILDPHTKSFAKLQEHRANSGWTCKWNIDGMGYKVYCAKCGEKVK